MTLYSLSMKLVTCNTVNLVLSESLGIVKRLLKQYYR